MSTEIIWKDVINYEGIYMVNQYGVIKSLDHIVYHKDGKKRLQKGRNIKYSKSKKGYIQVSLNKNCIKFNTSVHRVMAIAFLNNPFNKPQINHINGIKDDNRLENLEWCTNKENQLHAIRNNLIHPNYGENHHMSKIPNSHIAGIREEIKNGKPMRIIAERYSMSITAISNIKNRKTYINI